jgi:hypothetical protein
MYITHRHTHTNHSYILCIYACLHACMHACMYVCLCSVRTYKHTYMHSAGQRSLTDMMTRTEDRHQHKPRDEVHPSDSIFQKHGRQNDGGHSADSHIGRSNSSVEEHSHRLGRPCDEGLLDDLNGALSYEPSCVGGEEQHAKRSSEVAELHVMHGHDVGRSTIDRQTTDRDTSVRAHSQVQQFCEGGNGTGDRMEERRGADHDRYTYSHASADKHLQHVVGKGSKRLRDVSEEASDEDADLEACIDDEAETNMTDKNWYDDRRRDTDVRHHDSRGSRQGHVSVSRGRGGRMSEGSGCDMRANTHDTCDVTHIDSGVDDQHVADATNMDDTHGQASASDGARILFEAEAEGSSTGPCAAKRRRGYERHEIDESVLREVGFNCFNLFGIVSCVLFLCYAFAQLCTDLEM